MSTIQQESIYIPARVRNSPNIIYEFPLINLLNFSQLLTENNVENVSKAIIESIPNEYKIKFNKISKKLLLRVFVTKEIKIGKAHPTDTNP